MRASSGAFIFGSIAANSLFKAACSGTPARFFHSYGSVVWS